MSDLEFINYEKQELNDLQKTFTPEDEKLYGEEVRYINYLLSILEKQEKKPDTKKNKKKKEETKIKVQKALSKLVNNYTFKKSSDITHDELPPEAIEDAKLVEIGTKYYKMNGIDSDNYVAQSEGLDPNWKIDEELSDSRGVVFHNENTKKTKIAFRGTDAKGRNLDDIQTDAQIWMGSEGNSEHFKSAREQTRKTIEKYGKENTSTTGYSLGGNKSLDMGLTYDIPSTGFNSFIGKNIVKRPDIFTSTKHQIWRTREDLPSVQTAYLQGKSNIDVNVVKTRGSNLRSMNPYLAHELKNFTSNEDRSKTKDTSPLLDTMNDLVDHASKHGELQIFNKMIIQNKKNEDLDFNPIEESPSLYQRSLEQRINAMPKKSHLPKYPIPKELNVTGEHDIDGIPLTENIEVGVNPLAIKGKGKSFIRPVTEDISVNVNPLLQTNRNISIEPSYPRQVPRNAFVEPLTIDLGANTGNAELDDLLRFTQEQLRNRPIRKKTAKLDTKTKNKLTGLRDKTKPEPTRQSNLLENQADRLENKLGLEFNEPIKGTGGLFPPQFKTPKDTIPTADVVPEPSIQSKSFTQFAVDNGIDINSNNHKSLWLKSGGELLPSEKEGFDETINQHFNTDKELSDFNDLDLDSRINELNSHSQTQQRMEGELNSIDKSGIRSGEFSYGGEIARAVHPSNLIVGLGSGALANVAMSKYIDPVLKQDKDSDLRTAEEGAITGAITSSVLGTALAPEVASGAVGYVAGKEATQGIYKGIKSLGGNEDTALSLSDIGGGAAGGAAAGLTGTIAASALAGSAIGPEGTLIGAGVGAILGGAAYGLGKLGIGSETEPLNQGVANLDFSNSS